MRNFLTNRHKKYWANRKIDWKQSYWNPEHPHRELIIKALKRIKFGSIIEVGCGAGANLGKILQNFKGAGVAVGGIDISKDAIDTALEIFGNDAEVLEVSSIDKIFLSDKSSDVILSDMALIYISPWDINKAVKEIKRVARSYIVFVEFHHKSWFKRLALRLLSGYNSYDYEKLLKKHGFYNIEFYKLTEKDWPGGQPQKDFACLITAKTQ
jgi:ubiquinone/menaquinone biosynthesis C-methylase UbiE